MTHDDMPMANAPSGPQPAGLDAPRVPARPSRTIHMIGNAHLDPVWLWPWQEGYAEARATFWSVIHRMEEYPDFVFTCDQIVLLDWVREQDPVLFERIRERVAEGRWVNTGGWWVEPDCNMPLGESFARQGLYGQRFLLEHFGQPATVGMNVDPFGHNAMIPAILQAQGMTAYTFLRPGAHEATDLPDTPFWWVAPDGSRVLTCRIPFEYCSTDGDLAHQIDKGLAQLERSFDPLMIFYGVGNHGGGPTRANLDSIARYQRMGTYGDLSLRSPVDYFAAVQARLEEDPGLELPEWHGDLQHHAAGCYSAHSGSKAWQQRGQQAVLTAERWAVIADVLGSDHNPALADPRTELTRAWHQVLFNQFHDVLPGSAIEPAYEDARDQLGEAVSIAKRITTRAHNVIAREIDIPQQDGTQAVVVFNPHPWPVRTTVDINYQLAAVLRARVVDHTGAAVVSQPTRSVASMEHPDRGAVAFRAEVPATGYALYRLVPGESEATSLTASDTVLENDVLRVEIDPTTGWLASLLDKRHGVDLVRGAQGGHLQVCADPTDTWGHHVVSYAWPGEEMAVDGVRLLEAGPLRAVIRVSRRWRSSTIVEDFVLHAHGDAVEVRVDADWREPLTVVKLRVPLAISDPEATFEIPFATLTRPVDGAEEPAQSWVDLSGRPVGSDRRRAGLSVVTTAKHGFDTSPAGHPAPDSTPSIGITAVRSPAYAWNDPQLIDPASGIGFQDQGRQRWRYLLVPHDGDWRHADATRRGAELRQPVRAMLEGFHTGSLPGRASYAACDHESVMVTAIKGAEPALDGDRVDEHGPDVIVRAAETAGVEASAVLDLPFLGRRLEAGFGPYQVRTFRIPRSPRRRVVEVDLVERPIDRTDRPLRSRRTDASAPIVPDTLWLSPATTTVDGPSGPG